ncbi:monothiol glutaredoxin-S10 [Cryptomeria japonica]|uniref:monothiol glutaredoxin-S10 n=1 Tax=Cryptomeria japonica TaxID=3369 RepID=UPI0027D9E67A|nr:monothiol glutaredoxin-S10 [Cryptomeria japonica]
MASLSSFSVATSPRLTYVNGTKVSIDSFITQFVSCSPIKFVPPSFLKYNRGHGIKILAASAASQMEASIKAKISENPLVIYSKTRCSYCRSVKALFKRIGVEPLVVELDDLGPSQRQIQSALQRLTGQSTVPNIFIGGKHIGGCTDTIVLHRKGELIPLLSAAGLKVS